MWKCIKCETINDEQNRFCIVCGEFRAAEIVQEKTVISRMNDSEQKSDESIVLGIDGTGHHTEKAKHGASVRGKRFVATCLIVTALSCIAAIGTFVVREKTAQQAAMEQEAEMQETMASQMTESESHAEELNAEEESQVREVEDLKTFLGLDVNEFAYEHQPLREFSDYSRWGVYSDDMSASAYIGDNRVSLIEIQDTEDYSICGLISGQDLDEAVSHLEQSGYKAMGKDPDGYLTYEKGTEFRIGLKTFDPDPDVVECIYVEDLTACLDLSYFWKKDIREFAEKMPRFADAGASAGIQYSHCGTDVCADLRSPEINYIGFSYQENPYSICGVRYGMHKDEAAEALKERGYVLIEKETDEKNQYYRKDELMMSVTCVDWDQPTVECAHMVQYKPINPQYILPFSDVAPLTEADLSGLTGWELTLARNEIYARHGYIFTNPDVAAYFQEQSWYLGTQDANTFDFGLLSEIETNNVFFIQNYENKLYALQQEQIQTETNENQTSGDTASDHYQENVNTDAWHGTGNENSGVIVDVFVPDEGDENDTGNENSFPGVIEVYDEEGNLIYVITP